jgi:hypothetical protein
MIWVKNRLTEKYQAMRANGKMMATDNEIKSRAVRTARLIWRGLLKEDISGDCDYNFPLNQARVLGWKRYKHCRWTTAQQQECVGRTKWQTNQGLYVQQDWFEEDFLKKI